MRCHYLDELLVIELECVRPSNNPYRCRCPSRYNRPLVVAVILGDEDDVAPVQFLLKKVLPCLRDGDDLDVGMPLNPRQNPGFIHDIDIGVLRVSLRGPDLNIDADVFVKTIGRCNPGIAKELSDLYCPDLARVSRAPEEAKVSWHIPSLFNDYAIGLNQYPCAVMLLFGEDACMCYLR